MTKKKFFLSSHFFSVYRFLLSIFQCQRWFNLEPKNELKNGPRPVLVSEHETYIFVYPYEHVEEFSLCLIFLSIYSYIFRRSKTRPLKVAQFRRKNVAGKVAQINSTLSVVFYTNFTSKCWHLYLFLIFNRLVSKVGVKSNILM